MTHNEVHQGSVVELLARIARERTQPAADVMPEPDVVDSAPPRQKATRPPTRLFPAAPRRRT
jgi:hypothetical protein